MYLTWPRYQILGQEGVSLSYTAKFFYDLCARRDEEAKKNDGPLLRISSEVAFAFLTVAALVETFVLSFFAIGALFSKNEHRIAAYRCSLLIVIFGLYATITNLFAKNITSYLINFDILLRSDSATVFLFDACFFENIENAKALLDQGVDPHKKNPSCGMSPAIAAYFSGNERLRQLMPLNDYEKEFVELKILSHWLNFKGHATLQGEKIHLEGMPNSRWMFIPFAHAFAAFQASKSGSSHFLLSNKQAEELQEALEIGSKENTNEYLAERIRKRKLTFISTGWKDHAICLAFHGNYMAIGNRGEGAKQYSTLSVFRIDPQRINSQIVEEILLHQITTNPKVGQKYFYSTLPALLSNTGKAHTDSLCQAFQEIAPKVAQSGNCTLSSKKAALRFAWAMLLLEPPTWEMLPQKEMLQRARLETKLFTNWSANYYFTQLQFKEKFHSLQPKETLLQEASDSAQKKSDRYKALKPLLQLPAGLKI